MERASSGWAAFSSDNAIMEFDNAFAHRQAKTEPIDLPDQTVVHTMEAIKNAPKVLGGNTQAVIAHTDFEDAPCLIPSRFLCREKPSRRGEEKTIVQVEIVFRAPGKRVEKEREQPDAGIPRRASWPAVRACKRSVPGTRFLEEGRGKQGGSRGDLLGGVGSSMLKPPGDGFHKHRGHEVWHKLI